VLIIRELSRQTSKMDTCQILCTLRKVNSFLGVFPSDLLPPYSITQSGSIIINTDPHTEKGSHWVAINIHPKSSSAFYYDSYGLPPLIPSTQKFLRRNCTVRDFNKTQMQGLTSVVCGKYCCICALYMDKGFTPQFLGLIDVDTADQQIDQLFAAEFGPLREDIRGGQCSCSLL
jgi:hypothetical protein